MHDLFTHTHTHVHIHIHIHMYVTYTRKNMPLASFNARVISEAMEYNHVMLEINCHGNQGHTETDALGFMYKPASMWGSELASVW